MSAAIAASAVAVLLAGPAAAATKTHGHGGGAPTASTTSQGADRSAAAGEAQGHRVAERPHTYGPAGRKVRHDPSQAPSGACAQVMAGETATGTTGSHVPGTYMGPETSLSVERHMEEMERHMDRMNEYMGHSGTPEKRTEPNTGWPKHLRR